MKKFTFKYYGNDFMCYLPDTVKTHDLEKIGNITVPIPTSKYFNHIADIALEKLLVFCDANNLVLDANVHSYLYSEIRKFYNL